MTSSAAAAPAPKGRFALGHDVEKELPAVDGVDLGELRDRYAEALSRLPRGSAVAWLKFAWGPVVGCYAMPRLGALALNNVSHVAGHAPFAATFALAAVYALLLAGLGGLLHVAARRWTLDLDFRAVDLRARGFPTLTWTHGALAIATASAMALPFTEVRPAEETSPPVMWVRTVALDLSLFIVIPLAVWTAIVFFRFHAEGNDDDRAPLRPLDRVAVHMVTIAATVQRCASAPEEAGSRQVRRLLRALERLAVQAEGYALPRVPWHDLTTRRAVRLEGLRLAAVIRAHKPVLATALSARDYDAVARSLTAGLGAWARGDLAAMTRNALDVAPPGRLRQVFVRLWPAILLAAAGIVLPLVPPLDGSAAAAASARTSLLIGAVLALATGAVQAREYVMDVVNRTVLPK